MGREALKARLSPTIMLVIVTLLWGTTFPLVKEWQDQSGNCPGGAVLGSLTLIPLRMALILLVFLIFRRDLFLKPTRREHWHGVLLGSALFPGIALQILGLAWTTPALCAFLTSLSSAWAPVVAFLCFRALLSPLMFLGLLLGVGGTVALADIKLDLDWRPGWGEGLTFLSSLIFGVQIIMLDRLGKQARPAHFTVAMLVVTGGGGLVVAGAWAALGEGIPPWLAWLGEMLRQPRVLAAVALLTVCSAGTFYWMNLYQPQVSASRAALIYLLEPIFAALFSILLGYEDLTLRLVLGGGLIIGGNLLVELPAWFRLRRRANLVNESVPFET